MNAATGGLEDRALARHSGPLGFPLAQDRSFNYDELRTALGTDNTDRLITRIGVLAQMYHLDQSRTPLGNVVAHILGSMSPDEMKIVAKGGAFPPRIEAMVSAEAETAKAAAAQAEVARHNPSGGALSHATLAAAGYSGLARYAQPNTGTASDAGSGGSAINLAKNSARFDGMPLPPANGNWASPAGQAYMRAFAVQQGLPWASGHPEVLRLGPSAVKALAAVNLKHENYQTLTKTFGLTPRETVKAATEAKKRGVDLNKATEQGNDIRKFLPPSEQHDFDRHARKFYPNMSKPEAQREYKGYLDKVKKEHPDLAPKIEEYEKTIKIEQEREHKAKKNANAERNKADAERNRADEERNRANAERSNADSERSRRVENQTDDGRTAARQANAFDALDSAAAPAAKGAAAKPQETGSPANPATASAGRPQDPGSSAKPTTTAAAPTAGAKPEDPGSKPSPSTGAKPQEAGAPEKAPVVAAKPQPPKASPA